MARMWSVMMLVVLAAVPAWAQDRDRGWAHLSFGGAFSTAGEETRRFEGRYFGEPFIDQADYPAPKTTWTFDVGGVGEIIDHRQTGYLARPRDVSDLANGLAPMLDSYVACRISIKRSPASPRTNCLTRLSLSRSMSLGGPSKTIWLSPGFIRANG